MKKKDLLFFSLFGIMFIGISATRNLLREYILTPRPDLTAQVYQQIDQFDQYCRILDFSQKIVFWLFLFYVGFFIAYGIRKLKIWIPAALLVVFLPYLVDFLFAPVDKSIWLLFRGRCVLSFLLIGIMKAYYLIHKKKEKKHTGAPTAKLKRQVFMKNKKILFLVVCGVVLILFIFVMAVVERYNFPMTVSFPKAMQKIGKKSAQYLWFGLIKMNADFFITKVKILFMNGFRIIVGFYIVYGLAKYRIVIPIALGAIVLSSLIEYFMGLFSGFPTFYGNEFLYTILWIAVTSIYHAASKRIKDGPAI